MTRTGAAARPAFEDRTESAMDWARTNAKALVVALIVVGAAALTFWFYQRTQTIRATRAEAALNSARQSYTAGNMPLAEADLKRLTERYDGTAAATQAAMLLAQLYYDQGKADEGIAALNAAKPSDTDDAAVEGLKAAGLEQKGQFAEAAARYLAAAGMSDRKNVRDTYTADAARAFATADNKAEAIRLWTQLAEDEQSFYAAEAKVRLGELTAKTATQS
jgi:predicted negative regulator of RcsB-dependent stress response